MNFFVLALFSFTRAALGSADYSALFPYSFEVCALSQSSRLGQRQEGPWGHAALLIHGACRDENHATPRLKICPPRQLQTVGISVNSLLKNARWLLTEGEPFILNGILDRHQLLDAAAYQRTQEKLVESRIFQGLRIHENRASYGNLSSNNDPDSAGFADDAELRLARTAIGIDTAFGYSRDSYCARMPIPPAMMRDLIDYLNSENAHYERSNDFNWNFLSNNCAHLIHNALASLGFWDFKLTDLWWAEQLRYLAIPSHEFIRMMQLGNPKTFPDVMTVHRNPHYRRMLMEKGWLPHRPGTIARVQKIHQPNALFDSDLKIFILDRPWGPLRRSFSAYTTDPAFQSLEENLKRFRNTYRRALTELRPIESYLRKLRSRTADEKRDFVQVYQAYRRYLQQESQLVDQAISDL